MQRDRSTTSSLPGESPLQRMPAWGLSLLLHLVLLVTLVLLLKWRPQGASAEPGRTVGIALANDADGERQYLDANADEPDASPDSDTTQDLSAAVPDASVTAIDLSGALPALPNVGAGLANSSVPTASDGRGGGGAERTGGQVSTSVFGAEGEGSKFVYVFDRSGSMEGFSGRPLAAAKRELIQSLRDLQSTSQFQIIFYNERPEIFRPGLGTPKLIFGTDQDKRDAEQFVRGIRASGGTRHLEALNMALNLSPDIVFFLTDADEPRLSESELQRIRRWNRSASIHAIEFGFGPQRSKDNFLVRLAQQNGGQHVYVDVSRLVVR